LIWILECACIENVVSFRWYGVLASMESLINGVGRDLDR
jgi:hypothetical protein